VSSREDDTSRVPSGENASDRTALPYLCPFKTNMVEVPRVMFPATARRGVRADLYFIYLLWPGLRGKGQASGAQTPAS
jgi:hypothetical protein